MKIYFSRAGLLLHLERYQEALVELEELRQIAPKESLVYYLLSKVCYCLNKIFKLKRYSKYIKRNL
jgi:predicted Zn-dependent protease